MEDILGRLGKRIRALRIERGYASQDEASQGLGLHRAFVGHLETGRKDFRLTTLVRVANVLGVTLSELFEGLEEGQSLRKPTRKTADQASLDKARLLRDVVALERITEDLRAIGQAEADSLVSTRKTTAKRRKH